MIYTKLVVIGSVYALYRTYFIKLNANALLMFCGNIVFSKMASRLLRETGVMGQIVTAGYDA